jgi:hypothetical protein
MSRSFSSGSQRLLLAVVATLLLGLSCAVSASAATVQTNCIGLQNALKAAGNGDVITLDELCTNGFPYKLPNVAVTLAGTPGAGFDGGTTAQLEGGGASATIEGLTFEHAENNAPGVAAGLSINTAGQPFSYTLADDAFVDDAAPMGGGGGARLNTSGGVVTVTGSTFTGDSSGEGGGLFITADTATITGDTFEGDSSTANGDGGGLSAELGATGSTLSGSVFRNDTATDVGGGADISLGGSGGVSLAIVGNIFSHDSVADPSGTSTAFLGYSGGGLALDGFGGEPTTAVQSGNTFDSNSVSFQAAPTMAAGGGEGVDGAILQSTDDHFTNNSLQSPSAAETSKKERVFGWGAGVSIIACADSEAIPPSGPNLRSTLSDAVVAGNTLASGPSANGAGVYVGSFACHNSYAELALVDSTVSGNAVLGASGPIAGISGGPHDVLSLANTILAGDGGPEIGGFNSLASVTAANSDVCSGVSPFAGAGNICAAPLLAGASAGDVHETSASPTIDAGSNALVPSGLSTDAFGVTRILPGHAACGVSFPAVVDIGAAELQPIAPLCPPPILKIAPPRAPGLTHFVRLKTNAKGAALTLSCSSTDGLGCSGTIFITTDELLHGKKIVAISLEGRTKKSVRLAQTRFSIAPGATATIQVKLNSTGLTLLRRFHAFSTFLIANEASPTSDPFIFLFHTARFSEPKPKPKKHHPRRSKHRKHH